MPSLPSDLWFAHRVTAARHDPHWGEAVFLPILLPPHGSQVQPEDAHERRTWSGPRAHFYQILRRIAPPHPPTPHGRGGRDFPELDEYEGMGCLETREKARGRKCALVNVCLSSLWKCARACPQVVISIRNFCS